MADNKSSAPRAPRGVSAKKPPKVIVFRPQIRTRSTGTTVSFSKDSAELDEAAQVRLDDVVPLLMGKPNKVEIRVWTPRLPLSKESPFADTWQLCQARCMAIMKYLLEQGIDTDRIRLSQDGQGEPFTPPSEPGAEAESFPVEVFLSDELVHR